MLLGFPGTFRLNATVPLEDIDATPLLKGFRTTAASAALGGQDDRSVRRP